MSFFSTWFCIDQDKSRRITMTKSTRDRILRTTLIVTGLIFIGGIGTLMRLWPAGFAWTPAQGEYELMFVGVYATLGVFLLMASRAPEHHRSLILFTAWSSIVHGLIMAVQASVDPTEHTHLVGDVPALLIIGAVLLVMAPGPLGAADRAE
jgi:hypothetical protein